MLKNARDAKKYYRCRSLFRKIGGMNTHRKKLTGLR